MKDYVQERLAICSECPEPFKPTWTCKECGCFVKVKSLLPSATCPLDRWPQRDSSDAP